MPTPSIPLCHNEPRKTVFPSAPRAADNAGMSNTIQGVREKSDHSQAGNGSVGCSETEDKKLLEALRQSKLYRDYERTFTEATGLPLALRPVEFFGLPFHGKKNENPFCAFLAERKSCCALCLQTQGRLNEARAGHSAFTSMPVRSDRDCGADCSWRAGYRLSLHRPGIHCAKRTAKHVNHEACAISSEAAGAHCRRVAPLEANTLDPKRRDTKQRFSC